MDKDDWQTILGMTLFCGIAWAIWFFNVEVDLRLKDANRNSNYLFYSLALGLFTGVVMNFFKGETETKWLDWLGYPVAFGVPALMLHRLYEGGFVDGSHIENYLVAAFWYVVALFSWGMLASAFYCCAIAAFEWNSRKKQREFHTASQQKFEEFFDQSDADFEYEEQAFSGRGYPAGSSTEIPRGVDKRHPDDAKLWAVVDDPQSAMAERMKAMETIGKRETDRNPK